MIRSRLLHFWETLHSSYWFVPALMTAGAVGLSYEMLRLDRRLHFASLTGTTFSITIAALSLASSQFGSRLLRGFIRDTGNQTMLGTFIGTFVYCLLVLRTVRGSDQELFVPNLAVTGGVLLSLAGVGVLIHFINHVSASIQVSHLIAGVTGDLNKAIDRLYPGDAGQNVADVGLTRDAGDPLSGPVRTIPAACSGYVQIVDESRLTGSAARRPSAAGRLRSSRQCSLRAGSEPDDDAGCQVRPR